MTDIRMISLEETGTASWTESEKRLRGFSNDFRKRRSVRQFADEDVPQSIIRMAIETALNAPSGANLQPWRFVAISDPSVRSRIRDLAEAEEREFYADNNTTALRDAVRPLGTHLEKPHFEDAPWAIAVFAKDFGKRDADSQDNAYVVESVGLATGVLLSALNVAGVDTLVHVPVAEDYLIELAGCGENERLLMLVLAGRRARDAFAPQTATIKQPFHAVASFIGEDR